MDCSDDDALLASAGADKTIKIWGLDFGDTHKTLLGHTDSITGLKFVRRTHLFFTVSKDKTLRYWDADKFEQILILDAHAAEIQTLVVAKTGGFVLTGGMDRQIRVWERTKDIVFVDEEKEKQLERALEEKDNYDDMHIDSEENGGKDLPQSEAAVRKSMMNVSAGDRLMEALEFADQEELKRKTSKSKVVEKNLLLLGLDPPDYIIYVLKTIPSADLESSLLILPLNHMERLLHYLIILIRLGSEIELCIKVVVFIIKTHEHRITSNRHLIGPMKTLQSLIREKLGVYRDMIGLNITAMRMTKKLADESSRNISLQRNVDQNDIWADLGVSLQSTKKMRK